MADLADLAGQQIDREMNFLIHESRNKFQGESATQCECGAEIPQERRLAIKGIQLCVDCATYLENKRV